MKRDKLIIIAGGVLLIFLIAAGYYFFLAKKPSPQASTPVPGQAEEVIPTIAPDELGLTFVARSDGKAVKFEIAHANDIASVDYEVSYLTAGEIPRGVLGSITKKKEEETIAIDYQVLGSCSSGKCKYDTGVTSVKLVLKITKSDGKVYQAEKTLAL